MSSDQGIDRSFIGLVATGAAAMFLAVWQFGAPASGAVPNGDGESASFSFCHEGAGYNCVVDGDTFHYRGAKIRIADIDTPETHPARCEAEATKGAAATQRLYSLLNAGSFTLKPIDRDEDIFGRKLRIVTRNGASLGGTLVNEGLARWYAGGRRPWC